MALTSINYRKLIAQPGFQLAMIPLCLLPFLYLLFHFFTRLQELETLEEEIVRVEKKASHFQEWQQKESSFLTSLKNSDHFYIDKHLETLVFLETEAKKIEALLLENDQDEGLKKRAQFLTQPTNHLLFAEERIRQHEPFQEAEEKQQHPVEMNEEDLKKLLSLIEGVTIWPYGPKENRPQLIITDFQLTKKELSSQENVFVINLQLLKREASSSQAGKL
jgi:hypothetical protein